MWVDSALRRWLRGWRAALSGDRAISPAGAVIGGAGSFFTTASYVIPAGYPTRSDHPFEWTLIDAIAGAAFLFVGWLALRRVTNAGARFAVTLASFFAAGVVRTALEFAGPLAPTFQRSFVVGSVLNGMVALVWFSLPAVVLTRLDEYRAARARLLDEQEALSRARVRGERLIDDLTDTLLTGPEGDLPAHLRAFAARAHELAQAGSQSGSQDAADFAGLADDIRDYSGRVVRGVSHELADRIARERHHGISGGDALRDAHPRTTQVRAARVSAFVALTTARPFAPVASGIMALFVFLIGSFGALGAAGIPGSVAMAAVLGGILWLPDLLLGPRIRTWTVARRSAFAFAVYVIAGGVEAAIAPMVMRPESVGRSATAWMISSVFGVVLICIVGGAIGAASRLGALNRSRQAAVAALRWESVQTDARLQDLQAWVADVLHGEVQSKLLAAAAQLDLAVDDDKARSLRSDPADVADAVGDELDIAVSELASPGLAGRHDGGEAGVRAGIKAVADAWDPILIVTIELSDDDARAIDGLSAVADGLVRAVREAAANAYRHGGASRLDVDVVVDPPWVTVVADDNGIGPSPRSQRRGLGLATIAGPAGHVRFGAGPTGAGRLEIDIPMA